ncbi:MAG TPA: hypothetical protein VGC54_12800 [Planctomycetota bacterium]
MATTAVFAELLVIGVQVLTWMGLLLLAIAGPGLETQPLAVALAGSPALAVLLVVSFAYLFGILADRLADSLFHLIDDDKKKQALAKFDADQLAGIGVMRTAVLMEGGAAADFLDYVRSRMRVVRASALNLPMIGWAALLYAAVRTADGAGVAAVSVALGAHVLGAVCVWAWLRIHTTYCRRLAEAWLLTAAAKEHAAAVAAKQAAEAEKARKAAKKAARP